MRKYLILLLLCGFIGNSQNLYTKQIWAKKAFDLSTNTEIGGVSATISTPALLATKLGISVGAISNFTIVGSDIKCKITGSYVVPAGAFQNNTTITYFDDLDNLVTDLGNTAFKNDAFGTSKLRRLSFNGIINLTGTLVTSDSQLEKLYLGSCISIPNNAFSGTGGFRSIPYYYIPLCTSLGTTSGDNGVFTNSLLSGSIVICHPSLATNNGGSPDGDIQSAISQGATIRYKTNTTAPSQITTLAAGTIYNTAIQLNFTPPSSTNSIEYYECYANGVLKNTITASGQYITGLTPSTSYNITLKAVDIFYNKSVSSNILSISTTNRSAVDADAIAYITASSNTTYQDIIDDMFVSLKSNSLYTKIQAFYPFLGTTAAHHKWNAKNPLDTDGANRLVFTGSGTFSNNGYLTNGTGTYANTFLIPNTSQSLNSNGMTITVGTNDNTTSGNDFIMGVYQSGTQMSLLANKNNNTTFSKIIRLNGSAVSVNNGNTPLGVFTGTKQSSTVTKLFRNGVLQVSGNSGGTLPTIPIWIGDNDSNGSSYSNIKARIQFTAIHEGLSDAEVATLHIIINTFETALGRKTW